MCLEMSKKRCEVTEIILECQKDSLRHSYLIPKLIEVYKEVGLDDFFESFIKCVKIAFSHAESSDYLETVFLFFIRFVTVVCSLDDTRRQTEISVDNADEFSERFFEFICSCSTNPHLIVRRHACEFVTKLLKYLDKEASLDVKLCYRLTNAMLEPLKDKSPVIRVLAVNALHRLQNPSNPNCSVTRAFHYHLEHDPSVIVRRTILSKIGLSNCTTVEKIIDRTKDTSDKVRYSAYMVLSKYPVLKFKIAQRVSLLKTGLKDFSADVQLAVKKTLLPAWFKYLKNDYILLLEALDICIHPVDVAETALLELFNTQLLQRSKNSSQTMMMKQFKSLLDDRKLIPLDQLTLEKSVFWYCVMSFINTCKNRCTILDDDVDETDSVIELLPRLTTFCAYIRNYYLPVNVINANFSSNGNSSTISSSSSSIDDSNEDISSINDEDEQECKEQSWKVREKELILNELIKLCRMNDFSDVVGRQNLLSLLLDLLKCNCVQLFTLGPIIELYFSVEGNTKFALNKAVEVIVHLCLPKLSDNEVEQIVIAASNNRATDLPRLCQPQENDDPTVLMKCMKLLQEMLNLEYISTLDPTLRWLFGALVLPLYMLRTDQVSTVALEVMGLLCLRDIELAKEHLYIFCVELSNEQKRIIALNAIFDLLAKYGLFTFDGDDKRDYCDLLNAIGNVRINLKKNSVRSEENSGKMINCRPAPSDADSDCPSVSDSIDRVTDSDDDELETSEIGSTNIIEILIDLFDHTSEQVRLTVMKGMSRLILIGLITSVNLISRLILAWFHPSNSENAEIQQMLGCFFSLYVQTIPEAQASFRDAFLPTMRILFNAPPYSPLTKIDQGVVIKMMLLLTSSKFRKTNTEDSNADSSAAPDNYHNHLAVLICEELLSDSRRTCSSIQLLLSKALCSLDLTFTDEQNDNSKYREIVEITSKLEKRFSRYKDKSCFKNIRKFQHNFELIKARTMVISSDRRLGNVSDNERTFAHLYNNNNNNNNNNDNNNNSINNSMCEILAVKCAIKADSDTDVAGAGNDSDLDD